MVVVVVVAVVVVVFLAVVVVEPSHRVVREGPVLIRQRGIFPRWGVERGYVGSVLEVR